MFKVRVVTGETQNADLHLSDDIAETRQMWKDKNTKTIQMTQKWCFPLETKQTGHDKISEDM